MPKQFLEDMVKAKHARQGNMQELRLKPKEARETKEKIEIKDKIEIRETINVTEFRPDYTLNKSRPRYFLWFIALVSAVFCFFAISLVFAKATVLVNPKTENVTLNENLSATKDSDASGLSFDLVVIPGEETETVPATGEKNVSTSATGTVVIFNSYSTSPQTLSVDTKLLGSNGETYKTQTKTVVPGMSKSGTPGEIQVGIYAVAPGEAYNSGPLDFTIMGFKGTAKYSKFIVRSESGKQISGGFVGQAPDVSAADMAVALSSLKNTLQTSLQMKAMAQIPDGYILFKDAVFINTDDSDVSSAYNPDNTATITLAGTLYGVILNEQALTTKIAQDNIENYDESDVYIPDIKNLIFALSPATTDGSTLSNAQNINFSLTGPAQIVWNVDVDKFTSDLLGKPKKDFTQILSQYPNIDSATLTITPIWKMSIPDQNKNVKVVVNYPK
jgi:hypothetical protein